MCGKLRAACESLPSAIPLRASPSCAVGSSPGILDVVSSLGTANDLVVYVNTGTALAPVWTTVVVDANLESVNGAIVADIDGNSHMVGARAVPTRYPVDWSTTDTRRVGWEAVAFFCAHVLSLVQLPPAQ